MISLLAELAQVGMYEHSLLRMLSLYLKISSLFRLSVCVRYV